MSWSKYVKQHLAGRNQTELAAVVGVSQAAISRWLKDSQGVDADKAVEFVRRVGDTPIAALVAAGFLTPDEAQVRPAAAPDFSQLSNDELLELVRSRMREEEVGNGAGGSAATTAGDEAPVINLNSGGRRGRSKNASLTDPTGRQDRAALGDEGDGEPTDEGDH